MVYLRRLLPLTHPRYNPPMTWQKDIPHRLGALPFDGDLLRTEPGGNPSAKIGFLGVYPALTKTTLFEHEGQRMPVPIAVERESFAEGSASGKHLRVHYLEPMGVTWEDVRTMDMAPYFMANTSMSKSSGRSMWDNVCIYSKEEKRELAVIPRPTPNELVEMCRTMPGNRERLTQYMTESNIEDLLTLGSEAAAFVRGSRTVRKGQEFLYSRPVEMAFMGKVVRVHHLAHPGNLMYVSEKNKKWRKAHEGWCASWKKGSLC